MSETNHVCPSQENLLGSSEAEQMVQKGKKPHLRQLFRHRNTMLALVSALAVFCVWTQAVAGVDAAAEVVASSQLNRQSAVGFPSADGARSVADISEVGTQSDSAKANFRAASPAKNTTHSAGKKLQIVASTPIIADLVRNVAPDAQVTSLVPPGADPHTFEPSLATIRDVAHADIAFSNQLLLEQQSLIETIDANLPRTAKNIALAQAAVEYGAKHRQLVEDASLSTIWLGFRADGSGGSHDQVRICATGMRGPGKLSAFTTGTFGQPTAWFASIDGFTQDDCVKLPTNAHTHMSWGFSHAGKYLLDLQAELISEAGVKFLGATHVEFLVGDAVDPVDSEKQAIDNGHLDVTAHLDGGITLQGNTGSRNKVSINPTQAIIVVPHSTATVVPDNSWEFLGKPGAKAWILAQAVLGRHVHGEIDPHLWHDVSNVIAYVDVIEKELVALDPENAEQYLQNAQSYREQLRQLDDWMREVIGSIPQEQRTLVTTHDSFGYLAEAYNMKVAGFVAPNPSLEPSVVQLSNLVNTLQDLPGKAVFLEPNSRTHVAELLSAAHAANVRVCEIYSDTFSESVQTYFELMQFNAKSLKSCLDPQSLPAWDFHPVSTDQGTLHSRNPQSNI